MLTVTADIFDKAVAEEFAHTSRLRASIVVYPTRRWVIHRSRAVEQQPLSHGALCWRVLQQYDLFRLLLPKLNCVTEWLPLLPNKSLLNNEPSSSNVRITIFLSGCCRLKFVVCLFKVWKGQFAQKWHSTHLLLTTLDSGSGGIFSSHLGCSFLQSKETEEQNSPKCSFVVSHSSRAHSVDAPQARRLCWIFFGWKQAASDAASRQIGTEQTPHEQWKTRHVFLLVFLFGYVATVFMLWWLENVTRARSSKWVNKPILDELSL